MAQIKRFSNAIELTAKGTEEKIRVDFTDKRIVNKLLRLIKKYKNIDLIFSTVASTISSTPFIFSATYSSMFLYCDER